MPREAKPAEEQEVTITEVPIPPEATRLDVPLVRCRVIYTGPARNKSVALSGQVVDEFVEEDGGPDIRDFVTVVDGERKIRKKVAGRLYKQAVPSGTASYDFSTHDQHGRLIRSRLMPDTVSANLRGKAWTWVEHLGHVREFELGLVDKVTGKRVKEFEVLIPPDKVDIVMRFIGRANARDADEHELYERVTA